ncbi:metalloprotease [Tabrizicola sp.]|uniref:metalloprotease n=1 Tax=Tabrizicola sp. TaxID=2005166 RepID=UPI003F33B63B
MLPLFVATIFLLTTLYALRGGLVGNGRALTVAGFDTTALLMGVAAVAAAVYFFDPMYGVALILSVMVHEFGHVAAYRVCGHSDARFRLIPLIGGVAISDQVPASHEKDFFITLMGPGICIAPMVLAMALLELDWAYDSQLADFLWTFAIVTGALNFFNLLPFWPLDGGRCLSILCHTFWPGGARQVTIVMSAAAIALAVMSQSMGLTFFALMGAQNLMFGGDVAPFQRPMSKRRGALAAGAYLATIAAFGLTGWPLLDWFF